jgi:spore germination protein YaaH
MGYYYYSTPALLDHTSLTDVAFRWLETDGSGDLFYEYWSDSSGAVKRQQALDRARQNGLKTEASVVLMGWNSAGQAQLHQLLSSADNRQNLIDSLRAHAAQFDYDGINVDLEGVAAQDRDNFTAFLTGLASALHQDGRSVSVAVPAKTAGSTWSQGCDYQAIGKVVDLVVIMAYDYNTSTPGQSAPMNWFDNVASYAVSQIPASKVLLGIGTYGYDWNLDAGTKKTFTQTSLTQLLNSSLARNLYFDPVTYTPYIDYIDQNGDQHRVWYENQTSLGEKYATSLENCTGGIAFWQLTGAFNDFYQALGEN